MTYSDEELPKVIGQGRTADILAYRKERIIKLYKEWIPEQDVVLEYEISKWAYSFGLPTPEPFEITSLYGRPGIVFQRITGHSLLSGMIRQPQTVQKHTGILAKLHAELHAYPADGIPRKQKHTLRDQIQAAPLLLGQEKDRIIHYLEGLPDGQWLCHGDFHPDNVLLSEGAWIVDWMNGMSGHPAGDAARTILLFSLGTMPDGTPEETAKLVDDLRKKMKSVYIKEYTRITGQSYTDIDPWILPVAAARLAESPPEAERYKFLEIIRERLRGEL